jgi:hypothetical protein
MGGEKSKSQNKKASRKASVLKDLSAKPRRVAGVKGGQDAEPSPYTEPKLFRR